GRRRAVSGAVLRTFHHAGLARRHHPHDPARDDGLDRAVPAPAADRPDGRQSQRNQRGTPGPRGGRRLGGPGVRRTRRPVPGARELTDDHLRALRAAWENDQDYRGGRIPIWVGGNSDAGMRRAVRLGDGWHPLGVTMPWLREAVDRITVFADEHQRPVPGLVPRIALRLTEKPVTARGRLAGEGTIDQIVDDLAQLHLLGADTIVLDPFHGDPDETRHPEAAWHALATVSARARHLGEEL